MKRWGFDPSKPVLLVLGGGTGAQGLNERIVRNLSQLLSKANILHLVGRGKFPEIQSRENYVAVEFLNEEMAEAYAVANIAVSRAGMGTLTELGVAGIPAVLVPLPGHQEKNAAYLKERGAAVVVANDAFDQVFTDTLLRLLADRDRRLQLSRSIADIFPADAAEKLARIIIENVKR
jgi:UDP-N-acetylglucosamine--N-acetylmuramyl-(pentapeptide) pyrophosphoryl-undecaprenol N-acetylglucosamine transferase